ncbi:hypothetical protein GA0074692_6707 [Micromonospora pallida]|uniref:Transposase DDE domain-containing protein n=1 Tax=Micromonospora pallida TaxID=145854 RepID=A0A1C6TKB4_9ACTN|nr:hypothetical protein [Micromonospora pallida]SCL42201.1 hypothetical protein GA0074692_6707 [Micromonospora pallida]
MIEKTFGWLQRNSGWWVRGDWARHPRRHHRPVVLGTKLWAAAQIALNVAMMLNRRPDHPGRHRLIACRRPVMKFEASGTSGSGPGRSSERALAVWDFLVAPSKPVGRLLRFWTGWAGSSPDCGTASLTGESAWADHRQVRSGRHFLSGYRAGSSEGARHVRWDQDAFRSALNWMIGKWNNFSLTLVAGRCWAWHPSVTLSTRTSVLAEAVTSARRHGRGGERGPELVHLGRGDRQPLADGGGRPPYRVLRLIVATPTAGRSRRADRRRITAWQSVAATWA